MAKVVRKILTDQDLENLTANDFFQLKLTEDEIARFREINKARELDRAERVVRMHAEQALLVTELQSAGLCINAVSDLLEMTERYDTAIPILLKHLGMPYSDVTKETIARALAVSETEVCKSWSFLVDQYKKAPQGYGIKGPGDTKEYRLGAKDGLACTLSAAVTNETLEELIALVKDRLHGESRLLLLSGLRRLGHKNPLAKLAIVELAKDPDFKEELKPKKKSKPGKIWGQSKDK